MTDTTQRPDGIGSNPYSTFSRVGRLVLVGMLVWLLLAFVVIPVGIRIAHGADIPLLSRLLAGRATTPVSEYLDSWRAVANKPSGLLLFASVYILSMAALCALATSGSRPAPVAPGTRDSWYRPAAFIAGFCVVSVTALFVIHFSFPVTYISLVVEDGWGEQVQFLSWLTIAFLLGWLVVVRKERSLGIAAFGIMGFVFAMEEISWGQRLLGISTPSTLVQYNYQNELNIHNINAFYVSPDAQITPWHVVGLVILVWTFLLPAVFRLLPRLGRLGVRLGFPMVAGYLWPAAITAAFFLLVQSLVKGHEIGELGAALFSVFVALGVVLESSRGKRLPGQREVLAFTALIVAVFSLAALSAYLPKQSSSMRYHLNRMATHHLPGAGLYEQAQVLFEFIEAHPEYRSDRSRLNHADVLRALGLHDEARSVLERELADQADRFQGQAMRAQDHRIAGEILGRLTRDAESMQSLAQALELDRAELPEATAEGRQFVVYWSLARTYRLLSDTLAVAEHMQAALETPIARDRQMMEIWLLENGFGHLLVPPQ